MGTEIQPTPQDHYFSIILEGIRSDFRAVTDEVFSIRKELRESVHRLEGEIAKVHQAMDERFHAVDQRFERLEARFDDQERRFNSLESRFDNQELRFNNLETRFDDQHRQIGGIMEMVAQNAEDIYSLKETRLNHDPNKPHLV